MNTPTGLQWVTGKTLLGYWTWKYEWCRLWLQLISLSKTIVYPSPYEFKSQDHDSSLEFYLNIDFFLDVIEV